MKDCLNTNECFTEKVLLKRTGGTLIVKCKVLRIEEDIDFGCEERQLGAELMSVVLLENEDGQEISLRHNDRLLYERDINEGDTVMLDENRELKKV